MSRFILVTDDASFGHRVGKAISGGLTGTLHTIADVAIPETPSQLLRSDRNGEPVEVILLGPGVAVEGALRLASVFDVQSPAITLILVAATEPELALSAMRAGIRDILPPEADPETIRVFLERACRAAASRGIGTAGLQSGSTTAGARVIVVASPKGGVGKTTIAANVAVALGRVAPMSTVLVDLDAQFGDVAATLQLEPENTLLDAVTGAAKQDSMVLKAFLSVHHSSIYALCAPRSPADADRITGEDVTHLIQQLAGEFRYVVIDTAPGLGEHVLAALERATDLVLICTMDVPSVRSLRKELSVLDKLGLATGRRQTVVNLADNASGLSIRDIEATIGAPVDVVIPKSKEVALGTNRGIPLLQRTNRGSAARAMSHLANRFDPANLASPRKGIHKRAGLK